MRRVGAFADHDHAVLMDDDELTAVGFLQYCRVEYVVGPPFGNQPVVETHRPGQMGGHPVQIMGGEDDGDSLVIDLV